MDEARSFNTLIAANVCSRRNVGSSSDSNTHLSTSPREGGIIVGPLVSSNDPETYTVEEFCRRHSMSRSYFYEVLIPVGAAPAMTTLGRHRSITREAAAAWRAQWSGRSLPSRPKRTTETR